MLRRRNVVIGVCCDPNVPVGLFVTIISSFQAIVDILYKLVVRYAFDGDVAHVVCNIFVEDEERERRITHFEQSVRELD